MIYSCVSNSGRYWSQGSNGGCLEKKVDHERGQFWTFSQASEELHSSRDQEEETPALI